MVNAWLLFVTTKPPSWRDALVPWRELPPTVGTPHEGFFYPDPLGFWAEVRRWALELFGRHDPRWGTAESLSLTTLLHLGDQPERFARMVEVSRPRVVLFLDESSWEHSGLEARKVAHSIADPHRRGQVYEGFWGSSAEGTVVGKAPQHPAMHNLYDSEEMGEFLRAVPLD